MSGTGKADKIAFVSKTYLKAGTAGDKFNTEKMQGTMLQLLAERIDFAAAERLEQDIMELTEELKSVLHCLGADLVGIGDMSGVDNCSFKRGISVAVALPKGVVRDLQEAPTKEYYRLYDSLNKKLNEIVMEAEEFLRNKGFEALAQTTDRVKIDQNRISKLPHKTVATRAGLGWIGKNCLVVTPEFGSAVRISSLLTNAPLECDEPVSQSRCGRCNLCVKKCPAQALKGTLWEVGIQREALVDVNKCYKKQVEIMLKKTGIETDLCGKCFAVCAHTQRYLKNAD